MQTDEPAPNRAIEILKQRGRRDLANQGPASIQICETEEEKKFSSKCETIFELFEAFISYELSKQAGQNMLNRAC